MKTKINAEGLGRVEYKKQCDMFIQAAASLECAYRSLTAAASEIPFYGRLFNSITRTAKNVRGITLKAMQMAVEKGINAGDMR